MRSIVLPLLWVWPMLALATKPCQEDPCAPHGSFDGERCSQLAPWVVTGRVESIEHHPAAPPLSKDFAVFVVRVEKWEKGKAAVTRLRFSVGWCNNRVAPRGDRVRIFGDGDPTAKEPQYLWLETLP